MRSRTFLAQLELLEQMIFNGQVAKYLKRNGATRRSRTGDLLITNCPEGQTEKEPEGKDS